MLLQVLTLAGLQGITEFLPISSSGHLVLVPHITPWPDQGLMMDVAVHVGTLLAVLAYMHRDIIAAIIGFFRAMLGRSDARSRLAFNLIVASMPVVLAGYAFNIYWPEGVRSIEVIGWATIGFGLLMGFADKIGMTLKRIEHISYTNALTIGIFQAFALIPGASRSGLCMSAGRLLDMERVDAARFSLLLSIPAIMGAGSLKGYELYRGIVDTSISTHEIQMLLIAVCVSFTVALLSIVLMLAWLQRAGFAPFVLYRVLLGSAILLFAYGMIPTGLF